MSQKARIGVLGAGLMGHGIAQVFALAGHEVRIYDPSPAALETVRARIAANLRDLDEDEGAAQRVAPASTIAEAVSALVVGVSLAACGRIMRPALVSALAMPAW